MTKKKPNPEQMRGRSSRREARRQREARQKRQRVLAIAVIVIGVVLLVGLLWWGNRPPSIELKEVHTEQPPGADGLAWGGPEGAAVLVVEYSDFQCPYCARHSLQTLPQLIDRYGDNPNVRYEYRPFAFIGPESVDAAMAALCAAEQDMFWPYHDTLFANQGGENVGVFSKDNLRVVAEAVGLNMSDFNECFESGRHRRTVNDYLQQGRRDGISSTPMFFVNGELIQGAQPAQAFFEAIDKALAAAGAS